jgi:hypothetical protein
VGPKLRVCLPFEESEMGVQANHKLFAFEQVATNRDTSKWKPPLLQDAGDFQTNVEAVLKASMPKLLYPRVSSQEDSRFLRLARF